MEGELAKQNTREFLEYLVHLQDSGAGVQFGEWDAQDLIAGVLFEYDRGGYASGKFTRLILQAASKADPQNRLRLMVAFPWHVKLVNVVELLPDGAGTLAALLAAQGAGEGR